MTNIYPGFDKATHVPPNFVQTGPIMDPDLTQTRARLDRKDPELAAWMDQANAQNEAIIYISLGSEIIWQQWYIDAFYNGILNVCKQKKIRCIWAMKTEGMSLPEGYDKNIFWWGTWLP